MNKILFFLFLILSVSCGESESIPDVKILDTPIKIIRFDQLIFTQSSRDLASVHPNYFDCYYNYILGFADIGDTIIDYYQQFVQDTNIIHLHDSVELLYSDMSVVESEFTQAFSFYQYYFPSFTIPRVYSCISEFGPAAATCDSATVSISLDMYLGENYPYYDDFEFPEYMQAKFRKEYIVPNAVKALVKNIQADSIGRRLIDYMVAEGKILYIAHKILPYTADSLLLGQTGDDIKWLQENEKPIWGFFIENKLLFNTNYLELRKYITDGPTTAGMPKESPGNVGSWVGYRIISQFMKRNPEVSITQLIAITDGQKILSASKYRP